MEKKITITEREDGSMSFRNEGFDTLSAIGILTHCANRLSATEIKTKPTAPKKKASVSVKKKIKDPGGI